MGSNGVRERSRRLLLLTCVSTLAIVASAPEAQAVKKWFFLAGAQAQSLRSVPLPEEIRTVVVVSEPLRRATIEFLGSTIAADAIEVTVEVLRVSGKTEAYAASLGQIREGRWEGALRLPSGRLRRFRFAAGDILLFRFQPESESGVLEEGRNLGVGVEVLGRPIKAEASLGRVSGRSSARAAHRGRQSLATPARSSQADLAWNFRSGAAFIAPRVGQPREARVTLLASAGEAQAVPCLRYLHFRSIRRTGASTLRAKISIWSEAGRIRARTLRLDVPDDQSDTDVCFPPTLELREGDVVEVTFGFVDLPPERLFDSINLTFASSFSSPEAQ